MFVTLGHNRSIIIRIGNQHKISMERLKAVFHAYGLHPYPNYVFYRICKASISVCDNKLSDHQLKTVRQYYGYYLGSHCHALADAYA